MEQSELKNRYDELKHKAFAEDVKVINKEDLNGALFAGGFKPFASYAENGASITFFKDADGGYLWEDYTGEIKTTGNKVIPLSMFNAEHKNSDVLILGLNDSIDVKSAEDYEGEFEDSRISKGLFIMNKLADRIGKESFVFSVKASKNGSEFRLGDSADMVYDLTKNKKAYGSRRSFEKFLNEHGDDIMNFIKDGSAAQNSAVFFAKNKDTGKIKKVTLVRED